MGRYESLSVVSRRRALRAHAAGSFRGLAGVMVRSLGGRASRALAGGALLALGPGAGAQIPLHAWSGDAAGDRLGDALCGLGDVNGDGVADLAVGARGHDAGGQNAGAVLVVSGADGTVLYALHGSAAGELFGLAVADAGDVDGDGFADVVIGAPYGGGGAANGGAVRVVSGRDGSVLLARDGGEAYGLLGFAVAGVGDVNGDGLDDVLAGAPEEDANGTDSGVAYVWTTAQYAPLRVLYGDAPGDRLGRAVAGAGDVDGDGVPDLLVGAPRSDLGGADAGLARVVSGATGAVLHTLLGGAAGDELGLAVAGAGDVDGDGRADVIVGAWAADGGGSARGAARVVSGATGAVLHALVGDADGDRFGWAVAGGRDLDGDGRADLVVGAPGASSGAGSARAYSGASGAVLFTLHGESPGAELGHAVALAGDVDGDGRAEVLAGAPLAVTAGSPRGRAVLASPSGPPPARYCTATANSTGHAARIEWSGSLRASLSQLELRATGLPRLSSAVFVHAPAAAQVPLADGWLCVGPTLAAVQRLPAEHADATGVVTHAADLAGVVPGTTWHVQCWYRDPLGRLTGGTGMNLSDALALTFAP